MPNYTGPERRAESRGREERLREENGSMRTRMLEAREALLFFAEYLHPDYDGVGAPVGGTPAPSSYSRADAGATATPSDLALPRIEKRPGKCGGNATIRGTRLTVRAVHGAMVGGHDPDALWPEVDPKDITAALAYAAEHPEEIAQEPDLAGAELFTWKFAGGQSLIMIGEVVIHASDHPRQEVARLNEAYRSLRSPR